ncbi:MAG: dicarboxylate/amino acid:cation symporter [Bacteroidales bacterium]|nr:dicarboxylate/amino acid:cation symporter [Bacteroidales bacterium]
MVTSLSLNEIHRYVVEWWGPLFLKLLKLIALPVVCLTIMHSICIPQKNISKLVSYVLLVYLTTTIIAASIGVLMGHILSPGKSPINNNLTNYNPQMYSTKHKANYWFDYLIPENFFKPFTENSSILYVLFIVIFLGIVSRNLSDSSREYILKLLNVLLEWILKAVEYVLLIAPIGIFSLISNQIIKMQGNLSMLYSLLEYMIVVVCSLLIMAYIIYPMLLFLLFKYSPIKFIKSCLPVQLFAFTTSSSAATIPVTLNYAKNKLKVKDHIAEFVIPLGATVNMDGTAIYQAIATLFASQLCGISLTLEQNIILLLILVLSSIGTPSIPSGSIVIFSLIFQQFNLPLESIAIIMSVDRILDMARTVVNVTGDLFTSVTVSKIIKD